MIRIALVGFGLLLSACSHGLQEVGFAIPDAKDGQHYIVTRDVVSSRWTANQPHVTGQFHCITKISSVEMASLRQDGNEHTWYRGCTPTSDMPQHKYVLTADQSNASLAQGPVTAAILSAGVAFAGHQIGRGLKGSGDTVNQNGGGASSSSESESSSSALNNSGNKSIHNGNKNTNINSGNTNILKN